MIRPVLTEKSLTLASRGWYTFATDVRARKEAVGREVAAAYGVTVTSVRMVRMPQKTRRVGRLARPVARPAWKKALVTLAKGQTIDIYEKQTQ